jgi:hypothetical protein
VAEGGSGLGPKRGTCTVRPSERNPQAGGRRKQSEEGVPGVMAHTARALLGRLSRHLPSTSPWSLAFGSKRSEDLIEGLALFFRGRLCAELRFAWRGRRSPLVQAPSQRLRQAKVLAPRAHASGGPPGVPPRAFASGRRSVGRRAWVMLYITFSR